MSISGVYKDVKQGYEATTGNELLPSTSHLR
jgi:hypothetical protein